MRISYEYDAAAQALYIRISDGTPVRQVEMPDGVIVDVDADDQIVGVDIMHPSGGWDVEAVVNRWAMGPREAAFLRAVTNSVLRESQVTHGEGVLAPVA